jgi:exosortase
MPAVRAPPQTESARPNDLSVWGTWGIFAMVCWLGIDSLRWDWVVNPQYSYGWLVPFLGLYLFWKRWGSRPGGVGYRRGATLWGWAAIILAAGLMPLRVVRESSPDWAPVRWAMAMEVVGLTISLLGLMGGGRSARHFAWPVAFFLVAVPWPSGFESALTQGLMQRVAQVTAGVVEWAGYEARAQGNLICLATGTLGVDEACSGVRSLQSMLMASVFLGEAARLSGFRRMGLVVAGLALALCFNLLRSLVLVAVAVRSGLQELEKWHDSAGISILVCSFAVLLWVLRFFEPRRKQGGAEGAANVEAGPAQAMGGMPRLVLSCGWVVGLGVWLVSVELVTEGWYRTRESRRVAGDGWTVRLPNHFLEYRRSSIGDQVRKILAYDKGEAADWRGSEGTIWRMFFFKWAPGRTSTQAAREHRPEVCLPATGRTLRGELPEVIVPCGNLMIPFRAYEFSNAGRPMYVFFCLWEDGNQDLANTRLSQEWTPRARLERVLAGRRNLGQQSLELIVLGSGSFREAEAGFRRVAAELLAPEGR